MLCFHRAILLFSFVAAVLRLVDAGLSVRGQKDGSYVLDVNGQPWLKSGPTTVQAHGRHHSTADQTLPLAGPPGVISGSDTFGGWKGMQYHYVIEGEQKVNMAFRSYKDIPIAIFSQTFPDELNKTTVGNKNAIVSAFPSFHVGDSDLDLGFMLYSGVFIGWTRMQINRWKAGLPKLADGLDGGPLVLFDQEDNVLIISPFNQFMSASLWHNASADVISWGIMGDVNNVPAGFRYETVIYCGSKGINKAMADWGKLMRVWYRRSSAARKTDISVNYLGYYTDNGAYYYNVTEPGMNYEQTMLGAYSYSIRDKIPYRYLQYDDWFYPIEGPGYGATVTWDARPSVFPHGLRYLFNKTELPVVAHNRYWSHKTTYAKQNGGRFNFVIDGGMSLPDDQTFWDYLFATAKQWGLVVYEQDWLNHQTEKIRPLYTDIFLGSRWLKQMGEAASRNGLQLQYCMALPRHLLASLEIPAVSHIRASIDYHLDDRQWTIGITSMFADALGLAPFKDNFWSKEIQPGNKYNKTEPNPLLQAVVAVLSTGPVGVGDRIGHTNGDLLIRTAAASGKLLQPSKPATAIDAQILQRAFGGNVGPVGELWTTFSEISGLQFGVIFSPELNISYKLGPKEAGLRQDVQAWVYSSLSSSSYSMAPRLFDATHPLQLAGCSYTAFCLAYTTPVLKLKGQLIALLGEIEKIVPMSPQRVTAITLRDDDVTITIAGTPTEVVKFYVSTEEKGVKMLPCSISGEGTATLSVASGTCL